MSWNKGKTKKEFPQLSNAGTKKGTKPWNTGLILSREDRNCLYCNKEFNVFKSSKKRFCSNICGTKYQWENNSEKILNGIRNKPPMKKETKDKIRKTITGTKLSEETKKKIGESNSKENHWNWQGGITDNPYNDCWDEELREKIRERDEYICQICGITQEENNRRLAIHHIDFNKLNSNINNLISMCQSCHMKLHYKVTKINTKGELKCQIE